MSTIFLDIIHSTLGADNHVGNEHGGAGGSGGRGLPLRMFIWPRRTQAS